MTDQNNIFTSSEPVTSKLIEPGDVALLIKKDGTVQPLTFGYDCSRLTQPDAVLTDEDKKMLEQGQKLFALAFAAGHPKLMQTLIDIASDPEVVDLQTLRAATTRH
jgi:hypothetical protein